MAGNHFTGVLLLITAGSASARAGDYAQAVQAQLERAAPTWADQFSALIDAAVPRTAAGAFELAIGADGQAERLGLAISTGANAADDLARAFLLAAEPFPAPPPAAFEHGRASCLVRVELGKKRPLEAATACFDPGRPLPTVFGLTQRAGEASDPSARLFAGWVTEIGGNLEAAAKLYRKAFDAAPTSDLAARALGLALVRAGKSEDAMQYIEVYVTSRMPPADLDDLGREVSRFTRFKEAKTKPRVRLSKTDIAEGLKEGYDALEPCLAKARREYKLAVGSDTLALSFKIRQDGSAYGAAVEEPASLVMTAHSECLEKVVEKWRFPPFTEGDDMIVQRIPVKVRGTDGPPPPPSAGKPVLASARDSGPAVAEISRCMRGPDEINGHVKRSFEALTRCANEEHKRNPRARLPDALPIAFVVVGSGNVERIEVNHRYFRTGPFKECIEKAMQGRLSPAEGADCPAQFDLDLRSLNRY